MEITETKAKAIREEPRFGGIFPRGGKFARRIPLTSSVPQEGAQRMAVYSGGACAAVLPAAGDALRYALQQAAKRLYAAEQPDADDGDVAGAALPGERMAHTGESGCLNGKLVFCQDFAPHALVRAVLEEGGEPVFVDVSEEDWCMDPAALEAAFGLCPDVGIVLMHHNYGFPGQAVEIRRICEAHGALLIEDASESFGASCFSSPTGTIGDYGIVMARGDADQGATERSGAVQARPEGFPAEYIEKKRRIYERYQEAFEDFGLLSVNPYSEGAEPNFGITCAVCDSDLSPEDAWAEGDGDLSPEDAWAVGDGDLLPEDAWAVGGGDLSPEDACAVGGSGYDDRHGATVPTEIRDALLAFGAEAAPVHQPFSLQKAFRDCLLVMADGSRRCGDRPAADALWSTESVGSEIFKTALCLPSDVSMTEEEQDIIIEIIRCCFDEKNLDRLAWVDAAGVS